jgi:hypothetical protein
LLAFRANFKPVTMKRICHDNGKLSWFPVPAERQDLSW